MSANAPTVPRITPAAFMSALEQAVAEYGPDFVDPHTSETARPCQYVYEHAAGAVRRCIVGQALHILGVPDGALSLYEGDNATGLLGGLRFDGLAAISDDELVHTIALAAQCVQDNGNPWGDALDAARDVFNDA